MPVVAMTVLVVSAAPLAARPGEREEPRRVLSGVPDGELVGSPRGLPSEVLALPPELVDGLLAVPLGGAAEVDGWPTAPGERAGVVLTRHDVYAAGAELWAVGRRGRVRVPRSAWAFLWGAATHDPDVRVMVGVDPATREVFGVTFTADRAMELRRAPPAARGSSDAYLLGPQHLVRQLDDDPGDAWTCGQAAVPQTTATPRGLLASVAESQALGVVTAEALATPHAATVAIDTDTQLLARFGGDTTTATTWLASLFAQMNAIYQRDLGVRLVQGTTYLRTTSDPWTVNDTPPYSDASNWEKLQELTNWWAANQASVPRALTLMLSGRGPTTGASGIAWVDALCDKSYGYAFSRVTAGGTAATRSDVQVTAHEIGHVFGSPHTHCYNTLGLTNPDNCQSGETHGNKACYSGAPVCPATGLYQGVTARGTLMSYCHLLAGCSAELVLHPTTVALLQPKVEARTSGSNACIVPDVATLPSPVVQSVTPPSGPTTGGTRVTIAGSGFLAGATVTFGGVAATGVTVVSATQITAVTPAHAAGTVDVRVINPGGAGGTLSPGFYYHPATSPATRFYTVTPCRLVDTRNANGPRGGPALGGNASRTFQVAGVCGIPTGARSVAANVTVTTPGAEGFVGVYPGDAFPLGTLGVAFRPGQTRSALAVITLAWDGSGTVLVTNASPGATHFILDVTGYFQ